MVKAESEAMTDEEWANEQAKDKKIVLMKKLLEGTAAEDDVKKIEPVMVKEITAHRLENGVVKRWWARHGHAPSDEVQWLTLVPSQMQNQVLELIHDKDGHLGTTSLAEKIRGSGLFWQGYYKDVEKQVKSCELCQAVMNKNKKVGPLMPTWRDDIKAKHVVAIDVAGPLPETAAGNKYLVVSVSLHDMWPEAHAYPNVTQKEIINHLQARRAIEGVADEIWSDRGSVIVGEGVKAYLEDNGTKQRTTTSHNHQGAGVIEAQIKKIKEQLTKRVLDSGDDWDELLTLALGDLRDSTLVDLKATPYELRFKKKMKKPIHLILGKETLSIAAEREKQFMAKVDQLGDEAATKQKADYDKNRAGVSFEVGEKVLIFDHYRKTFEARWIGPFEIISKKSPLSYEIGELPGGTRIGARYKIINARGSWKENNKIRWRVSYLIKEKEWIARS
jgi:hypothetical protein